jgi:hypothetical protein
VIVGRRGAFIQDKATLGQGKERQLSFVDVEQAKIGRRIGFMPYAEADQLIENGFQVAVIVIDRHALQDFKRSASDSVRKDLRRLRIPADRPDLPPHQVRRLDALP